MRFDRQLTSLLHEAGEKFNETKGNPDPQVMLSAVAANVEAAKLMDLEAARPLLMESMIKLMLLTMIADNGIESNRLRSQRKFLILGDELMIAPESDDRTHLLWMQDEEMAGNYGDAVLGYVDKYGLYIYKGIECRQLSDSELWEIRPQLRRLVETLHIVGIHSVFNGLLPARHGLAPAGKVSMGQLDGIF